MSSNTNTQTTTSDIFEPTTLSALKHIQLDETINQIDYSIQSIIDLIIHHPLFQKLESTWIGISQQLACIHNSPMVKLHLLQLNKTELEQMASINQPLEKSRLYHVVYSKEFNTPGGQPYSLLIADYYFSNSNSDINCLDFLSRVGNAALCPILGAAAPSLFNLDRWDSIHRYDTLLHIPQLPSHLRWSALRQQPSAKFIFLTAPAYLGRRAYTRNTNSFHYSHQETINDANNYCWVNSAYAQSQCIINAYLKYGWCTAIRGKENGGTIYNLPLTHSLKATQTLLSDSQEHELSQLGIIPLCHYKNSTYAVIFASESVFLAPQYDTAEATQNAKISARLPYIIATSRFAHYLKIIARDKIGSFLEKDDLEIWLNRWISQYVNSNARSKSLLKARFPLADAAITLSEDTQHPGHYQAIIHMKPWLLLEELSASLRLVTQLPKEKN